MRLGDSFLCVLWLIKSHHSLHHWQWRRRKIAWFLTFDDARLMETNRFNWCGRVRGKRHDWKSVETFWDSRKIYYISWWWSISDFLESYETSPTYNPLQLNQAIKFIYLANKCTFCWTLKCNFHWVLEAHNKANKRDGEGLETSIKISCTSESDSRPKSIRKTW